MNTFKHGLRILAALFILSSFVNCNISKSISFVEVPPFTIGESYFQDWIAGVRAEGSGTNVHVNFLEVNENVEIRDVYFRRHKLKAQNFPRFRDQYKGHGSHFKVSIKDGEVVQSNNSQDDEGQTSGVGDEIFPFALGADEAVISYVENGVTRYYKFRLDKKPMTAYPKKNEVGSN